MKITFSWLVAVLLCSSSCSLIWTPPSPLPEGEPGQIIRSQATAGPQGHQAFLLLHYSRTFNGQSIAVTSTVMVPKTHTSGLMPIVAYGHGTIGLADDCAPSRFIASAPNDPVVVELAVPFLNAGYAVAITDYEGLGTPGEHPYLVGESEGRNVLDSVRAATRLGIAGLTPKSPVLAVGHSQGGQAVLFAAELAASYAPDINLVGVVAQAPAGDLATLWNSVRNTPTRGYLVMLAAGLLAADPSLPETEVVTGLGRSAVTRARQQCTEQTLNELSGADLDALLPTTRSAALQRLLETNSPGRQRPTAPMLLVHGTNDTQVPVAVSRSMVDQYRARGADVRLVEHSTDHLEIIAASQSEVLEFAQRRLGQ